MLQKERANWITRHFFDGYWAKTGNDVELGLAAEGEGIWLYPGVTRNSYEERPTRYQKGARAWQI